MKCWLVNPYALPPSFGGANRHHNLAKEIEDEDFRVLIVSGSFDHFSKRQVASFSENQSYVAEVIDGVDYVWVKTPAYSGNGLGRVWNMLVFAIGLLRTWKRIQDEKGRADVIVGSSLHLFGAAAAEWGASRSGSAFVLEIRDIWPATLIDLFGWSKWHPFVVINGVLERWLYRRSQTVISTMPLAESHFRENGLAKDAVVHWVPNGAICKVSDSGGVAIRNGSEFHLVYTGSLGPANALDELIEAVKILKSQDGGPALLISIYGDGPERETLEAMVERYGLSSVVSFEGRIPKCSIPGVLNRADATLLLIRDSPIYRWGYSMNKLADYMFAGCPVIAANVSAYNPVEDASAGLTYEPGNPSSLAATIKDLIMTSEDDRLVMGRNANHYAKNNFDIKALAKKFASVLIGASSNL